ncbi:MAG: guanylate kinase [bacterium]|nr:guanylate kinase [bacterium]
MSVLIIISGPSGVGKETLITEIRRKFPLFQIPVSYTTRPMREGDQNGVQYHFVTRGEFERMKSLDLFAESDEHFNNLYGTSKISLEKALESGDVLIELDVSGALQIKSKFPEAKLIFISPPSLDELEKRIRTRGKDSEESIRTRLARAEIEIEASKKFNHIIVNDNLEQAVAELTALVQNLLKGAKEVLK